MTPPPRRPWVLQCRCRRIRRIVRDLWLVCDTCDVPIPVTPPKERA